jgi:hypothetical protein
MAIRVKHAPSAAALGETAYTVGRGQRRERDIKLAAEYALRREALALQGRGQELGAERAEGMLGLRRDELEFRKDEAREGRETAERRWNEEPSRQLQRGLEEQERLRKNITWQYDEGQKRELDKITTGVAWLRTQVADGKWTAEQAEQAEQQLWQKYYSIIPLPVYDDTLKPQDMYNSMIVTDPITGARSMMNDKGTFVDVPGSLTFKDYSTLYTNTLSAMFKQDAEGKDVTDYAAVDEAVQNAVTRFVKIQGLATKTSEEQVRKQQRQQQMATEQEQQEQEQVQQAAVEALPTLFKKLIEGQPRIGRIKKGKASADKVYGEEAYNKLLIESIERLKQEGVAPDAVVVKAELDKWWDAQYDKERGQMFQKYGNRLGFKGAAFDPGRSGFEKLKYKTTPPEKREVTPEVDLSKLDKSDKAKVKKFKSGRIVWSWVRKQYGQETAAELQYICDSGNEQAIANALRRLGII